MVHPASPPPPIVERDLALPSKEERIARLAQAIPGIKSVCCDETDEIALMATLSCLLYETMRHTNWVGFYRRVAQEELKVGPYQGRLGCLKIAFHKGVCGRAASTRSTQLVPNVHDFPGHIACDSATKSELVVPIVSSSSMEGVLLGVLDLDSPFLDGFCIQEAEMLEQLLQHLFH